MASKLAVDAGKRESDVDISGQDRECGWCSRSAVVELHSDPYDYDSGRTMCGLHYNAVRRGRLGRSA